MRYTGRIVDQELDELLTGLAAVAIEGAKAVGKTATATQRARTVYRMDDPSEQELVAADPTRILDGAAPILIDEWQRIPESWDLVRRAVDADATPNQFLLTGSASPLNPPTHSGAGRIVRVRMRPMSLVERGLDSPTVSLRDLLSGKAGSVGGETSVVLRDYASEIGTSGFPAMRTLQGRALRAQLESYVARIVDTDFEELGQRVRRPEVLRRWLAAYAAATATTATLETIRDAATSGEGQKPSRATVITYRDILQRLWLVDPVPAWLPTRNYFSQLAHPEKHHLADPALAATLLGVGVDALLAGAGGAVDLPRAGTLLGHLFESLVTQSVRVYAQNAEASVKHLRTKAGRQEVDLIIERADHRVLGMEVKLTRTVTDAHVASLRWLGQKLGDDLIDAVVITTGEHAYRRDDGIAVVPAALLGP